MVLLHLFMTFTSVLTQFDLIQLFTGATDQV